MILSLPARAIPLPAPSPCPSLSPVELAPLPPAPAPTGTMRRVLAAALLAAAAVTAATVTASRVVAEKIISRVTFGGGGDVGTTYRQGNKIVFPRRGVRHWRARLPVPVPPGGNADTAAMLRTALWCPEDMYVGFDAWYGAYRVTLHFAETWATRPGQRVFGVSVGVLGTPLRRVRKALDLVAAAGGRAYAPVDVDVEVFVPQVIRGQIIVHLHKMGANYPCISGMTVQSIEDGRATSSPSSLPSRATTSSPLPSAAPTSTAMPELQSVAYSRVSL